MTLRKFAAAVTAAALLSVSLPATTSYMPVEEIRAGMEGVARTVFEGAELQEFKVRILGVLRNVQGPRRDLILARLDGERLAQSGVAQGMSGSPVYIDGKLIGAVSYSVGNFSKEPIAGITPIAEMKDATALPARAGTQQARLELPITREGLTAALTAASARLAPFARRPADVHVLGFNPSEGAQLGAMLRPISTPLLFGGFEPETVELLAGPFTQVGFSPVVTGASTSQVPAAAGPLREGDAIGVVLVGGDLEMGATGTVTHIDGDRVYAFGHPLYNLGPTEFPLTRAYVHTILPSLMTSFKISSLGETIGTMKQDRATAIAGTLGTGPAMVPMKVTLERTGPGAASPRSFNFQLVNDQLFTPLLAYVSLFNTLGAYERQFGAATFTVRSRVRIKGHADLAVDDVFTGDNPLLGAATAVAAPLTLLLSNDVEPVDIEGLDIAITTAETPRSASIERVWIDEIRPRAGRTIPLKILTRSYRGDETISTLPIEIPSHASGNLSVMVTDGRHLNAIEQREIRRSVDPQSVAQLVRLLNDTRRGNRIYIRLLTGTPGAVVNGEAMAALPPSVLAVFEGDRNGGSFTPIRSATLGEWELPMDAAVSGSRLLTITVEGGPVR
jgi:hypothetical protein